MSDESAQRGGSIDRADMLSSLRLDRPVTPTVSNAAWYLRTPVVAFVTAAIVLVAVWVYGAREESTAANVVSAPQSAIDSNAPMSAAPPIASSSLLDASGYVVARRRATVSSKITGKVTELFIEEGQRIESGEVMAKLDESTLLASVHHAEAQLAEAGASLEVAKIALADAQPIYDRNLKQIEAGVISAQSFDTARSTYHAAKGALLLAERAEQSARANLKLAHENLNDATIRAPFSGVVTDKAAQLGEIVSPMSAGGAFTRSGIGTIVDMDSLEVEVDVSESFINRVSAQQPVTIRLNAYPELEIRGKVIATIPSADRAKATVRVRVALDDKDPRVLPDMGASVAFLAPVQTAKLVVESTPAHSAASSRP